MVERSLPARDVGCPPALADLMRCGLTPCGGLRARGVWPAPRGVAIVGTRSPTPEAVAFTRDLAAAIVDAGWAVWSGGALGIDAAAHAGAMDRGGRTVLVSPSGLDVVYPPEHAALFQRIADRGGTLVSAWEDRARPMLPSFHRRNAILAALTIATVVVQAGETSGARSTARAARKLRRPLFVVPHAPWEPRGRGCALELEKGALALARVCAFLSRLQAAREPRGEQLALPAVAREGIAREHAQAPEHEHARTLAREHARTLHGIGADEARVLAEIGETPLHTDDLCERTALPFATVTAALLTLTLHAVVVEAPAGFYRRSLRTEETESA